MDVEKVCHISPLPHWGRVTHICVSELTIIGSDNGFSPWRRQAIIWNNAGLLLIEPIGTNVSEISIEIQTFSIKKMHLNMSSEKWRPFCLGLNVSDFQNTDHSSSSRAIYGLCLLWVLYYSGTEYHRCYFLKTLRPRNNDRHFPNDICRGICFNEYIRISMKISLKFVPNGSINDIPALVQIMAWRRPGDKPLSEPIMIILLTHICVTRPQWVKNSTTCHLVSNQYHGNFHSHLALVYYMEATTLLDAVDTQQVFLSLLLLKCSSNQNMYWFQKWTYRICRQFLYLFDIGFV